MEYIPIFPINTCRQNHGISLIEKPTAIYSRNCRFKDGTKELKEESHKKMYLTKIEHQPISFERTNNINLHECIETFNRFKRSSKLQPLLQNPNNKKIDTPAKLHINQPERRHRLQRGRNLYVSGAVLQVPQKHRFDHIKLKYQN